MATQAAFAKMDDQGLLPITAWRYGIDARPLTKLPKTVMVTRHPVVLENFLDPNELRL